MLVQGSIPRAVLTKGRSEHVAFSPYATTAPCPRAASLQNVNRGHSDPCGAHCGGRMCPWEAADCCELWDVVFGRAGISPCPSLCAWSMHTVLWLPGGPTVLCMLP